MKVSEVFFTHDRIRRRFRDGRSVSALATQLRHNPAHAEKVQPLEVLYYHGRYHSINNRRLEAFRQAQHQRGDDMWCKVVVHPLVPRPNDTRNFLFKFFDACSTRNRGESVEFY